jgi:hypothetical protein
MALSRPQVKLSLLRPDETASKRLARLEEKEICRSCSLLYKQEQI